MDQAQSRIARFDVTTGAFLGNLVGPGAGGLDTPWDLCIGPGGDLYVASAGTDSIKRYDSATGAYLGEYIANAGGAGMDPVALAFVPSLQITVGSTNTAPQVSAIEPGPLLYAEGDGSIAITGTITVNDADSGTLTRARIAIGSGYQSGADLLEYVPAMASLLTATWDGLAGVLTIDGAGTPGEYQQALQEVHFLNASDAPTPGDRSIEFSVFDGALWSNTDIRIVQVQAVNDAPVLANIEPGTLSYAEDAGAVPVSAAITVADADSANLQQAHVSLVGTDLEAGEYLVFTDTASISGVWDPGARLLTLSGSTDAATWQAALRSVRYGNSSQNPPATARQVQFEISDGTNWSAMVQRAIVPVAANDRPVLGNVEAADLAYTEGDAATPVSATLTVSDPDDTDFNAAVVRFSAGFVGGEDLLEFADTVNISATWIAGAGELDLIGNASLAEYEAALRAVTYRNLSDAPITATNRTIEFTLLDASSLTSLPVTRTITVTAVNDAPQLNVPPNSFAYNEGDAPVLVSQGSSATDPDSPDLDGGVLDVAVTAGATGSEVLSIVSDGTGPGQVSVSGSVLSYSGVAIGTVAGGTGGTPLSITFNASATPSKVGAVVARVAFSTAGPTPGAGARTLTYTLSDGDGATSPAQSVSVTVAEVNTAPVIGGVEVLALQLNENAAPAVVSSALQVTDDDSATMLQATIRISSGYVQGEDLLAFTDTLNIIGDWNPLTGTLTLNGADTRAAYEAALRSVTYENPSDAPQSSRVVAFVVIDDQDAASAPVTRAVEIVAANDAPKITLATTSSNYAEGDAPVLLASGMTIVDPDSADFDGGSLQFALTAGATGSEVLAILPGGSGGQAVAVAGTTVSVGGVAVGTVSGGSGGAPLVVSLNNLAGAAQAQAIAERVGFSTSGFTPGAGTRSVSITVLDGDGGTASAIVVQVDVTDVAQAPQISNLESTALVHAEGDAPQPISQTVSLADPDSANLAGATIEIVGYEAVTDRLSFTDTARITGTWDAIAGRLALSGVDTVAAYQAALRSVRFEAIGDDPGTHARSLILTVTDDTGAPAQASRNLTVLASNDAPIFTDAAAGGGADVLVAEGDTAAAVLAASDVDSATLGFSIVGGADAARFTLDASSGALAFATPPDFEAPGDANADGVYELVVTVTDEGGASANAALRVIVTDRNDAPVIAVAAGTTVSPGAELIVTSAMLRATDADVGDTADRLTYTLLETPANGTLSLNGTALAANDQFTQADVDAGRVAFSAGTAGVSTIRLKLDDDGGATAGTAELSIVVAIPDADPGPAPTSAPAPEATSEPQPTREEPTRQDASATDAALLSDASGLSTPTGKKEAERPPVVMATEIDIAAAARQGSDTVTRIASLRSGSAAADPGPRTASPASLTLSERSASAENRRVAALLEARGTERFNAAIASNDWRRALDDAREKATSDPTLVGALTGGSAAAIGGLSVGYVFWLLRGGMLLTSLLSTIPAWYAFDPMPVLARRGGEDLDADDDQVEGLFGNAQRSAPRATPATIPAAPGEPPGASDARSVPGAEP
ncbi:MAG: cadherin-like domain-containing protein [Burkholderiaceae bacterium]